MVLNVYILFSLILSQTLVLYTKVNFDGIIYDFDQNTVTLRIIDVGSKILVFGSKIS